jgi:HlyD family secretion protein
MENKGNKDSIFRQSALEQLSSPERLDQLMQVINPMDWIALLTLGSLVGGSLIWSIVGRIPMTVDGQGIFIQPRRVIDVQSNIAGQLSELRIRGGQCVAEDEILATIEPTELKQQLFLAQGKLVELQSQAQSTLALSGRRIQVERGSIAASRDNIMRRLEDARALTPILKSRGLDALQEKRRSLEQRLRDARALVPVMQQRLENRRQLATEGAMSRESILDVERQYVEARQTVADIEVQLKEQEVQLTQTEREYLNNIRSISDLEAQLQELNTRSKRLDQESLETVTQRNREIQEINREVIRLEQQITLNSKIRSSQAGCILEVNSMQGQVVQPGSKIGTMQVTTQNAQLSGVLYFPAKDGKQIQPGMTITITPDTVQRERFGGVLARVASVSQLPVTREGATAVIGNPEVVQSLFNSGGVIEVHATLETDPRTFSGFKWSSSKGPESKITPGTPATARTTVEDRPPITFVLPFLRDLVGLK